MGLSHEIMKSRALMDPDLPSCRITYCHLPFQSKWLYIGTERGNIHIVNVESFTLSGYVIMWNKAIELWVCISQHSLLFVFFSPSTFFPFAYLLCALVWVDTQPANSEMQRNVLADTVCPARWESCSSDQCVRAAWRWWLCHARTCCWDFRRCLPAWFNRTSVIGRAH